MNEHLDSSQLHAYVDGELAPDDVAAIEHALASDPVAAAEVAALRAQKSALHGHFDRVLAAPHRLSVGRERAAVPPMHLGAWMSSRAWIGTALAATLVGGVGVGIATGWFAHERADMRQASARANDGRSHPAGSVTATDVRLGDFVHVAAISHAIYTPEVRHPVEVAAADEAHLVAWLSKRLGAPLVVPHLEGVGWNLLGGRLLPAQVGPIAQFMYQDDRGRRLTLAVSHARGAATATAADPASSASRQAPVPAAAFRIAEEGGNTIFYWIDADFAYALTGPLARAEMTELAGGIYRQLDR